MDIPADIITQLADLRETDPKAVSDYIFANFVDHDGGRVSAMRVDYLLKSAPRADFITHLQEVLKVPYPRPLVLYTVAGPATPAKLVDLGTKINVCVIIGTDRDFELFGDEFPRYTVFIDHKSKSALEDVWKMLNVSPIDAVVVVVNSDGLIHDQSSVEFRTAVAEGLNVIFHDPSATPVVVDPIPRRFSLPMKRR